MIKYYPVRNTFSYDFDRNFVVETPFICSQRNYVFFVLKVYIKILK